MTPLARRAIAEQPEPLDDAAEPLQQAVRNAVPQESNLKDLLSAHGWGIRCINLGQEKAIAAAASLDGTRSR